MKNKTSLPLVRFNYINSIRSHSFTPIDSKTQFKAAEPAPKRERNKIYKPLYPGRDIKE